MTLKLTTAIALGLIVAAGNPGGRNGGSGRRRR
jgi:hypothetical protein